MGIRVNIEVWNVGGSADMSVKFADAEAYTVERLGQLIGYAVNATDDVLVHAGNSLHEGISDTLCDGFKQDASESEQLAAEAAFCERDYRLGKQVAVKYAGTFEGIQGRVTKVLPSGSHGIEDEHGVLIVQIGNNLSLLAGADQFRTA